MSMIQTARGSKVLHGGVEMKVVAAQGFDSLTLQSAAGEYFHVSIAELEAQAVGQSRTKAQVDLKRQEKVPAYLAALGPLLGPERKSRKEVAAAAEKLGISVSSAYAAIARFRVSGSTDDLPPPTRPGGRGKSRLLPTIESVIEKTIEDILLNRRNFRPRSFYKECHRRLSKKGLQVSQATLRNRVARIPDHKWTKSRKGYNETRRTHDPLRGVYPEVQRPLEVVQIDHWKADIEVLSEDRLTVVGRVWITLVIDVYSRMVYGLHVGFDAPSTTTLGLAMINGMLRKDAIAKKYGFEWNNPIGGPIQRLEADNAGEFRGESLQKTADHFQFRLKWRPLGAPQYGGHIERLNGTLATRFKELPGATGSTPKERAEFRPEMTAAFTIEDLTRHVWLLVDEYHNDVHTGINMTPLEKFTSYFFGPNGQKHRLPPVYVDNLEFRQQWYPLEYRSLQRYGIRLDYLDYFSEEIEYLVKNRKQHGKLMIRRNPFDVREIYLFHPVREEWITVPTRHINFPIASIYELKAARRTALERKRKPTPELLAKIIDEQHANIEAARKKTKTAQREAARRAQHQRIRNESPASAKAQPKIDLTSGPSAREQTDLNPGAERQSAQLHTNPAEQNLASILAGISDEDIEDTFA